MDIKNIENIKIYELFKKLLFVHLLNILFVKENLVNRVLYLLECLTIYTCNE